MSMIKEFTDRFISKQDEIQKHFKSNHPSDYKEIVKTVIGFISDGGYGSPDKENIVEIDHGSYQGTLVFIIPEVGYQPSDYWYVRVYYGSCSGCDTLESICSYSSNPPTDEQAKDYTTLALHVVQGIRAMGGEGVA